MTLEGNDAGRQSRTDEVSEYRTVRLNWQSVALAGLILFMLWQVVIPLVMVVWTSVKIVHPADPSFLTLDLSWGNYVRVLTSDSFRSVSITTAIYCLSSTFFGFAMAAFLAWVAERTDTPGARIIGMLTFGRIFVPSVVTASAWVFIGSPTLGILNHMLAPITGIPAVVNIYTLPAMIFVQSLEMVPLAFIILATGFRTMDPRLEEASTMTGASTWRTFAKVTLPLNMPSVLAALFLLFIISLEGLEVPAMLGFRGRVFVYSMEVYLNSARTPTDWGLSSTYAMVMMIISGLLLALYLYLTRQNERYETITGKDFRPRRLELGKWGYLTCGTSIVLLMLMAGIPLLAMLYTSFLDTLQVPSLDTFQNMTLDNYRSALSSSSREMCTLWNSIKMSTGTATAAVLIVSIIAYFVHKTTLPGRKFLDFLGFVPIAIPSILIGTATMWIYLLVPFDILNTLLIIGLAVLTKYLPFALRFVSAAIVRIHRELEEAAILTGSSWPRNLWRIYLPLLKPGLIAAWIWVFVNAYRDLPIPAILHRTDNRTAADTILGLSGASWLRLSTFGVIMFTIVLLVVAAIYVIGRRSGSHED